MWQLTKRNNSVRRTVRSQTNQIGLFPQPFILAVLTLPPRPSKELLVDTPSTSLPMVDAAACPPGTLPPRIPYVSTTYQPPFEQISFTYRFRIVSASGSENDRRTIGEQYGIDTGSIRNQYGINTESIRDRYENDTRRLPTEVFNKIFNFPINISLYYILHFVYSLHPIFHAKMTDTSIVKAQQLYKDNSTPCQKQDD